MRQLSFSSKYDDLAVSTEYQYSKHELPLPSLFRRSLADDLLHPLDEQGDGDANLKKDDSIGGWIPFIVPSVVDVKLAYADLSGNPLGFILIK